MGVITFILGLNLFAADTTPVTIHLELAKDTLALAEPTVLTVKLTNNLDTNIYLQYISYCAISSDELPYSMTILLVTPTGEILEYEPMEIISIFAAQRWFTRISPRVTASYPLFLRWDRFQLEESKDIPFEYTPGTYMICVYRHINISDSTFVWAISDTVSVVFQDVTREEKKEFEWIKRLLSLEYKYRHGEKLPRRLYKSQTPYSESAFAELITPEGGLPPLAEFEKRKAEFDSLYPTSEFAIILLQAQLDLAEGSESYINAIRQEGRENNFGVDTLRDYSRAADSLRSLIEEILPTHWDLMRAQGYLMTAYEDEIWEKE